ncbi:MULTISPECIES: bifunctional metallophosphatase/5'-nucleotidase [unclassified Paenibacillus]|uniref:bifunctional metallophosphatase/5'-nucleotidase n=1 Tax=unclassified Paenibacillus TaxID=185978 RepID=UPI0009A6BF24|nr:MULTISPECIES: 5'-nucleotidase C-terminal domain-containing protein [unclassified Paenibacillus]SLK22458.1 2',3'-cyclic-nucleotide 2'-phosphodiesterase/5'-or 3'-nucleotidase, 5'-nucleotidase family [Paenibacillus sp. RU5A]SOC77182.1 2',3'-cyclic-nucleotide 2'-phosphodiesterase/5'-or 3'-nucleotidase, 5'-nucleotidase family [Paenibacillus sp. RU26A]SOC78316.1 2',3'-cyclic-nucleotide 2'-phosphodiesterase/5'-or 3'-nucleotidase, 5'-nucleotidase family [Paenibacillus sp. RU5M]
MSTKKAQTLTILHTNDIHSHFGSMSSIAAMIGHEKEQAGEFLVVDIGDHMDRMAVETEGTLGAANVDVINLTGYDAITIGNNEGLTFTSEQLAQSYSGLLCPVVCGNVVDQATGLPPVWMKSSLILEKGPFRIGLLGATAPFTAFYELLGWDVLDPVETLRGQVEALRPQVDVVVILSHLGLSTDRRLAEQIQGIDVILGGHTHHVLEEQLIIGQTVLGAAGKFGQWLGKVVLEREYEANELTLVSSGCVPVQNMLLEESVSLAIDTHRTEAERALGQTAVITDRTLTIDYDHESPFASLLAQAVRQFTGAQLSLVNAGQLLGNLPQGNITKGMLHSLCPSPINACTICLNGIQIREALEQSLLSEFSRKPIIGFGFRGDILGTLCMDGMDVEYDPHSPPYEKIRAIYIEGEPIHDEHEYVVGTLDMFTFNVGYPSLALGTDISYRLPEFIRDLLETELKRPGALDDSLRSRWHKI